MNRHNQSIIRDGNHFVRGEECGWVLIDGPWFDSLQKRAKKLDDVCTVLIASLMDKDRGKVGWWASGELPSNRVNVHFARWRRIKWHPGHITTKEQDEKLDMWTRYRLRLYEAGRVRLGWTMDGILPARLDGLEFEEE